LINILCSLAISERCYGGNWVLNCCFQLLVTPQTNGQIEVVNRTLTQLMCVVIQKNLRNWENCLLFIEFAYNRSVHSITGFSPFEIVYEFNPLTSMDLIHLLMKWLVLRVIVKHRWWRYLIRVWGNKLKRETVCMQLKSISGANMLSFSPTIELGCTCTMRDFRLIENPSYNHKEMSHFRSLRGSMTAYKVDLLCEYGVSTTFNVFLSYSI